MLQLGTEAHFFRFTANAWLHPKEVPQNTCLVK